MRILIAEDDLDISTLYKKALEKNKHQVVITSNGEECLNNYRTTLKNRASKAMQPSNADAEATVTDSFRDYGDKIKINIHTDSIFMGALGGAMFARRNINIALPSGK